MRCVLALFVVVCMVRLSLAHGDGSSGPVRFAGTFGPLCLYILSLLTRVRTVMAFSGGTWAEATAVASWIVMGGGDGSVGEGEEDVVAWKEGSSGLVSVGLVVRVWSV